MSNASEPPAPKPRLRWYQYRLRTLLIVMTLLAVWMAHISHRARQQKMAVEKVHRLGGTVEYDFRVTKNITTGFPSHDPQAKPPGPAWLRNFLGDDYFQTVVVLGLGGNKTVTDDDLALLSDMPDLKVLNLDETNITDDGLAYVKKLKKLEFLFLRRTSIGDRGLEQIKDITTLQLLVLSDTKVTDEGTKYLQNLNLKSGLDLANTDVSDKSLQYFSKLKNLRNLSLADTNVTETGAEELRKELPNTTIIFKHNQMQVKQSRSKANSTP
jgi:hypothetical protein